MSERPHGSTTMDIRLLRRYISLRWLVVVAILAIVAFTRAGFGIGYPLAPVLVIVPTSRLAAALRRRLSRALGAYLAIEVLPHRALSLRAAAAGPDAPPRIASEVVLATLLDRLLARRRDSAWAGFASDVSAMSVFARRKASTARRAASSAASASSLRTLTSDRFASIRPICSSRFFFTYSSAYVLTMSCAR